MKNLYLLIVCLLAFPLITYTQTPSTPNTSVSTKGDERIAALEERLATLIKTSVAKDEEIARLKKLVEGDTKKVPDPVDIEKAVVERAAALTKFKDLPIYKSCKKAKGKSLVTLSGNNLVYSGCIL
jgi:hypothetical protein